MNKAIDTVLAFAERNDIVPITLIKSCLENIYCRPNIFGHFNIIPSAAVISIEFDVKFSNTHHGYF